MGSWVFRVFLLACCFGCAGDGGSPNPVNDGQGDVTNEIVTFPDSSLSLAIAELLGDEPMTRQNLSAIKQLVAVGGNIHDLYGLRYLDSLQVLEVAGNKVVDISEISALKQLRFLNLADNAVRDISPLKESVRLEAIDVSYNSITDIGPILGLPSLISLDAIGNPLNEISLTTYLPSLRSRGVQVEYRLDTNTGGDEPAPGNISITDANLRDAILAALEGPIDEQSLSTIRSLRVEERVADLDGIEYLTNLKSLSLELGDDPKNVGALGKLENLEELSLSGSGVVDLSQLSPLVKLTSLTILGISPEEFTFLAAFGSLKKLTLIACDVRELSRLLPSITNTSTLSYLDLSGNKLGDIAGITAMDRLQTLRLGYNELSDITLLSSFHELRWLEINNNEIQDISVLVELEKLSVVLLQGNPLNDVSRQTYIPMLQSKGVRFDT